MKLTRDFDDDFVSFFRRRQWVPTFVTEFKDEPETKQVSKPDDIAFSSGPQAGPLMSLKVRRRHLKNDEQ